MEGEREEGGRGGKNVNKQSVRSRDQITKRLGGWET